MAKDLGVDVRQTSEEGSDVDDGASMSAETDGALARRSAAGDRDAFATLLERHYERIYRVGARVLGNDEEAADLAQDVCVGLIGKLPSYRGESQFTTWLYRVVVNAARDRLRRDGAMRRNEQDFAEIDSMIKAGRAERESEAIRLRQVLGALGGRSARDRDSRDRGGVAARGSRRSPGCVGIDRIVADA